MNDISNQKFPSGRTVQQVKKDAKRLKKSSNITLTEALSQCAQMNGIAMPWDAAMRELKRRALFASMLEEQIAFNKRLMPSQEYIDLVKKTALYPTKLDVASLSINLERLPNHVYETLICHPIYLFFIERFMQVANLDLKVTHPHSSARYMGEDWRLDITYDGYSGEGEKPCHAIWSEFKDWLMQFGSTQRVHVTQRVDDATYTKLVTQTLHTWSTLDFANKLEFDVDRALYCQMAHGAFPMYKVKWRSVDFSLLEDLPRQPNSHQATALFEYTLDGDTDTVAGMSQGSIQDYDVTTRALQLFTSALNTTMRHYKLTDPNIPMKMLNIKMGETLYFGVTQVR